MRDFEILNFSKKIVIVRFVLIQTVIRFDELKKVKRKKFPILIFLFVCSNPSFLLWVKTKATTMLSW